MFVGISGSSLCGGAAGRFAITDPALLIAHFGADPFDAVCTAVLFGAATVFHGKIRIVLTVRKDVLKEYFDGSLKKLIVALSGGECISQDEADELRAYIDEFKKNRCNDCVFCPA